MYLKLYLLYLIVETSLYFFLQTHADLYFGIGLVFVQLTAMKLTSHEETTNCFSDFWSDFITITIKYVLVALFQILVTISVIKFTYHWILIFFFFLFLCRILSYFMFMPQEYWRKNPLVLWLKALPLFRNITSTSFSPLLLCTFLFLFSSSTHIVGRVCIVL